MAGSWYDISVVMLCINIFLYIGASHMGATVINMENDALSQFIVGDFNQTGLLEPASASTIDINRSTLSIPDRETPETSGSQFLEVLNSLEVIWDALSIIFNIGFAPLVLFQIEGIPYIVAFLIAVPMVVLFWLSVIQFIRGAP